MLLSMDVVRVERRSNKQGHRQTMNLEIEPFCKVTTVSSRLSVILRISLKSYYFLTICLHSIDEISISDLEYRYIALCFIGYLSKCYILLCIANVGPSSVRGQH